MTFNLSSKTLYRWMVLSRCLAAIFGGYALAAASCVFLALCLPMARAEAVYLASLLSYLVFVVAVLWVFAARSAWGAWLGVIVPTAVLVAGCYGLKAVGL
jgi:hypothetical protein